MRSRHHPGGLRSKRLTLFFFVYAILLFHISGYVGNEMATTTMSVTMAVVEEGRLTIDSYIAGARELAYHNGHFYSGMPPGQSFVAVPLYVVLRPAISLAADIVGPRLEAVEAAGEYDLDRDFAVRRLLLLVLFTALLSAPCAAATCVMAVDLAEGMGERVGVLGALLLPLATIWWAYGMEYGPRVMGAFLLLLPIWWVCLHRDTASRRKRWTMAVVCGAGLALAPMIRYELIFAAVIVGLWLAWALRWRGSVAMILAGLVIAGFGAVYHNHCYGSPTSTSYSTKLWGAESLQPMTGHSPEGLPRVMYQDRESVVFNQARMLGFTWGNVPAALWADREALLRFSPFLLLMPVGAVLLLRRRRSREPAALLAAIFILSLVVLALMPHPGFRGAIGSRYMLWALPALVLLTIPAWNRLPGAVRGILFAVSFAPSYLAAMLGSHTHSAWSFGQLAEFGLTNYTLSRAQQAGLVGPTISTIVVLVFWAVIAVVFLRPGSRWCILRRVPEEQESEEISAEA